MIQNVLRSPLWDLGPHVPAFRRSTLRIEDFNGSPYLSLIASHGIDVSGYGPGRDTSYVYLEYRGSQYSHFHGASWHRDCGGQAQYLLIWANVMPTLVRWCPLDASFRPLKRWETTLMELGRRRFKREHGLVRGKQVPLLPGHLYLMDNQAFEHRGPCLADLPPGVDSNSISREFLRVNLYRS